MKLLKLPFTKRRLLAIMVGLVAGGGVAQAQFTGIGHTNPQATLHVEAVDPLTHEVLRVDDIFDYDVSTEAATFTGILRYDPATGLFRNQPLADLLDETGEWIENGTNTAIISRRYQTAMVVNNDLVNITATATTVGGTLGVTGASTFTGAATFNGAVQYNGTADNLDLDNLTTNTAIGTHNLVLIQDANGIVRNITVADLLDENGEWVFNTTTNKIEPRRFANAMNIDASLVNVGSSATPVPFTVDGATSITGVTTVTGATTITGATAVNGTFTVDASASALGGTLTVAGASTFNNTVQYAGAADGLDFDNLTTNTAIGTHNLVLTQDANGIVRNITVADLLDENGEWVFNTTTNKIEPRRFANAMNIDASLVNVGSSATPVPFTVDGATSITGVTTVTGATTITGATAVNGTFTVDASASTLGGTLGVTGATTLSSTLAVTGNTDLTGTLDIGDVNVATSVVGADEILFQLAGADLVQSITVDNLLASSSYWDFNAGTNTLNPSDVDIADDFILTDEVLSIGAATTITGATAVNGNFTVDASASTLGGTLDVTGAVGLDATLDVDGNTNLNGTLSIGTVAEISGTALAPLDEILLQRAGTNLVEYVTVQDLVSSNSEWVYEDNGTTGTVDAADRIYVRRLDATAATDDAVYVDGIGNMVVDATKAYQFGAATSQINAVGITAAADYTVDINGGSLTFATDSDEDVSFTENNEPWLYYQASSDYGPTNAFGNSGSERGRVGINTDRPEATLHVAGNIVASNVTVTSDRRFKKDIREISGALELVLALRGVSYDFRADEFPKENFDSQNHIGFIAQEIQQVLPQAVTARGDGYLTVDYAAVTPVLVEALQELTKKVEGLQAENAALRSTSEKSVGAVSTKQLRELEARLADMDARLQEVAGRK